MNNRFFFKMFLSILAVASCLAATVSAETEIDILVVFAPALGGSELNDQDVAATATSHINQVNGYLENSQLEYRFRLVGAESIASLNDYLYVENDTLFEVESNKDVERFRQQYGADLVAYYANHSDYACGLANLSTGSVDAEGAAVISRKAYHSVNGLYCGAKTLAHEIGHNMGLGHSYEQNRKGSIVDWGRGYGVSGDFATIMAYPSEFNTSRQLGRFSDADRDCRGVQCGVNIDQEDGSNATAALRLVQEQFSNYEKTKVFTGGDDILAVRRPKKIIAGRTAAYEIDYSTTEERELLLMMRDAGKKAPRVSFKRIRVRGAGTLKTGLFTQRRAAERRDYLLGVFLVPTGKTAADNLDRYVKSGISIKRLDNAFSNVSLPESFSAGETHTISFDYSSDSDRDVVVVLRDYNKLNERVALVRKALRFGERSFKVDLEVDSNAEQRSDYHLQMFMVKKGASTSTQVAVHRARSLTVEDRSLIEEVTQVILPSSFKLGQTNSFEIQYNILEPRTVRYRVDHVGANGYTSWDASGVADLYPNASTATLEFDFFEDVVPGDFYQLKVDLTELNGYGTTFGRTEFSNIVVEAADNESGYENDIQSVAVLGSLVVGTRASVEIEYTATDDSDLVVTFEDVSSGYSWRGFKRVQINAGAGKITADFDISDDTVSANTHRLKVIMVERDGGLSSPFDQMILNNVSVSP